MKKLNIVKSGILPTVLAFGAILSSCGSASKTVEAKATVDATTTAEAGIIQAQVCSMLGFITNIELKIEDGNYTFTKTLVSYTESDGEYVVSNYAKFEFEGEAKDNGSSSYTLECATSGSYDIDMSMLKTTLGDDMYTMLVYLPASSGTETSTNDATILNYFYTPYVKNNGENTKSMNVTIKDDSVEFEGFSLVAEEEE